MRLVVALVALVLTLPACGKKARETCEKAGARYEQCVQELFGDEAARMAAGKRDIGSCAKDEPTVKMYDECLPVGTCGEFMDCILDYAKNRGP